MIWSNVRRERVPKMRTFGDVDIIPFGERSFWDSRYPMRSSSDILDGINKELSITYSLSNMPIIENIEDDNLFLFVSTKGAIDGNCRSGSFKVNRKHESCFNLLLSKEGGSGEDDSPVWADYLVEVKRDKLPAYFAIEYAGSEYEDVYLVDEKGVIFCGSTKDHDLALYIDSTKKLIPGYCVNEDCLDQSWVRIKREEER